MAGERATRRAVLAVVGSVATAGCLGRGGSTAAASAEDRTAWRSALTDSVARSTVAANGTDADVGVAPLSPAPAPFASNPVITAADVTDVDARFVADPFLFPVGDDLHLFFEVLPERGHGIIGHAVSGDGGRTWRYDRIVLDPGYHVSYPLVFSWDGDVYLFPEDGRNPDDRLRLFRAEAFPRGWCPVAEPVAPDYGATDHALVRRDDTWWLFVGEGLGDRLHVYHSDDLEADDWTPHPANPVVERRVVRPAGRPVVGEDRIVLYLQDTTVEYGNAVRAVAVEELDPCRYRDAELGGSPVLAGTGPQEHVGLLDRVSDNAVALFDGVLPDDLPAWNADRMHHLDPWYLGPEAGWLCAVDGFDGVEWSIGLYVAPP